MLLCLLGWKVMEAGVVTWVLLLCVYWGCSFFAAVSCCLSAGLSSAYFCGREGSSLNINNMSEASWPNENTTVPANDLVSHLKAGNSWSRIKGWNHCSQAQFVLVGSSVSELGLTWIIFPWYVFCLGFKSGLYRALQFSCIFRVQS